MAVILESITRLPEPDAYCLTITIDGRPSTFTSSTFPQGGLRGGSCEPALFFLLSERSLLEKGDSAQYHLDLVLLLNDVASGKSATLPFIFGSDQRFPVAREYRWRARWARRRRGWKHLTAALFHYADGFFG